MSLRSTSRNTSRVRVWDPLVRLFHWSLALCFAVAWLSANSWESLHLWAGYTAGVLVLVRIIWGFVGTPYARFTHFVRSPRAILRYLADIAKGSEARYLGHNPAGGAMIVVLLLAMGATAVTGWMLTTNAYWGVTWVQVLHSLVAHLVLLLVAFHLAGVLLACLRHRENLVSAMIRGEKRAPAADDVA